MNKINLKERKKNMKQILQEMYTFEEPKVALLVKKSKEDGYYSLIKRIGGYIITTIYNEDGNLEDTKTLYFDEHGKINEKIHKIKTYIPKEITLEQLSKIDFRYMHTTFAFDDESYDCEIKFCNFLDIYNILTQDFDIRRKMPEKLLNEEYIMNYKIIIYKYNTGRKEENNLEIELNSFTYDNLLERKVCDNTFLKYFDYNKDNLEDLSKFIADQVVDSIVNSKNKFGFKYKATVKKVEVAYLRKKNSENEMIEKQVLKFVNEKLKERD